MGPPVRVVCLDCLQSIEVSVSGSTSEPSACPHCGCTIEAADRGLLSRDDFRLDSPPTVDLSEASTLRSDREIVAPVRKVGRFEIRLVLGEGGYGQVFRAFDPHLEREVALKVLKPNRLGEKALQRFYREARAAARLDHPNIVGLHDAGRDDGRCWIAYQLVSGRTLSALRDLARPSPLESIRIVRDLALGLDHAHGRGVFHRDLKPANVMIDDAGRPRLTDFGLARRGDVESDLTTEGTVLGTPQYMSPEAAAGRAHEADARSDVYSLGVILYELLCGRRPCDVPSGAPLWRSLHHVTPPTPRSVDRAIPPALDRICMKALALDPAERYADAALLAQALTDQIARYRPSRSPRQSIEKLAAVARPRLRRFSKLAIASSACLVVVAGVMLLVRPPAADPTPPPSTSTYRETSAILAPPAGHPATTAASDPEKTPPAVAVVEPAALLPFVGSSKRGNNRYHTRSCPIAAKLTNTVSFPTAEAAEQNSRFPCLTCRPDNHKVPPTGPKP